jgi:hypothetical protein
VARCSFNDGSLGRLLELPIWMFDHAACAPIRVETFPRVDIADAPGSDGADDAPHLRSRGWRSPSPTEGGAP